MIESAFRAALMAPISGAVLLDTGLGPTAGAAVPLAPITMPTDPEHRTASEAAANALPQKRIAHDGHLRSQTGLDKGSRSCQLSEAFGATCFGLPRGTVPLQRRGPHKSSRLADEGIPS